MRKLLKYAAIVLAVIFLLLVAVLLLTQTSFFRGKVKSKVIQLVENKLDLNFSIGELQGNFYNHLLLADVELRDGDSLLASFGSLKVNYNLKPLLNATVSIDSLELKDPYFNLWQNTDSLWNIATLIPGNSDNTERKPKPFRLTIDVKNVVIKHGELAITALSEAMPSGVKDINLLADGKYSSGDINIALKSFACATRNPDFKLKQLSGKCFIGQEEIKVDSLFILAGNSGIDFNGSYFSAANFEGAITAGKVDKEDFSLFVPSFKLLCSPAIKASFSAVNDSLVANILLQNSDETIDATLALGAFSHLQLPNAAVPYRAQLKIGNVNINHWISLGTAQLLVNGELKINGDNLKNIKSEAKIEGQFYNSVYNTINLKLVDLKGVYADDSVNAIVLAQSDYGEVALAGGLDFSGQPEYNVNINAKNLELHRFVTDLEQTILNGKIYATGKGFDPKKIQAAINLNLGSSTIYNFEVDSLLALANTNRQQLKFDTLQAFAPGILLNGSGQLMLDSMQLNARFLASAETPGFLDSLVELPLTFDSAYTTATLHGSFNDLEIAGTLDVHNVNAYAVDLGKTKANYKVNVFNDSYKVAVNAEALQVKTGTIILDTFAVDYTFDGEQMNVLGELAWNDVLKARFNSVIEAGDTTLLELSALEVNSQWADIFLPDTMTASIFNNRFLEISNLVLKDRNQEQFSFAANGLVSAADTSNFKVEISELDLRELNKYLGEEYQLEGILNSNFELRGRSHNPTIEGKLDVARPRFGNYALNPFHASFAYADKQGALELTMPELGELFFAKVVAAFNLSLDSLQLNFSPPETFDGTFRIDSVDLRKMVKTYTPNDSIKGILEVDIQTKGDLDNPLIFGEMHLSNGTYLNENIGLYYNDIFGALSFYGNKIEIDTLLVKQKNGLISVFGELEFDSTIVTGEINSSSLELDAKNFFLAKHRNYEILVDANTFVRSERNKPEFGGNIKVLRSDLYLPAFMKDSKGETELDVPLLVQALEKPDDSLQNTLAGQVVAKAKNKKETAWVNNLTGRLQVEIPRNTWIRSNDIRAELNGEVEIVKNGPYFELFGNVKVVRGQYILYGRKLNIKESEINFQGGEDFDPTLNIEAEYVYRGSDKEKRYLEMLITGEMSDPEIRFMLDDVEISETDGISVLVFGATSDEIGYGGNNGLINSIGSNAVASMISSQLSKTIGSQLNLDMIEITTTENWQSAAFVVGKYITNDIFVIYQRGFGEVSGDEITPETVTIEYEINDKLFLRLQSGNSKESGVDVILKFEQELEKHSNIKNIPRK
ncbi:translocation/assembly module TamB domain-containing protein [uncultured Draconibacterium sp.]|uniref:translocation/assembly module TamB domain-containing protein n=1 Tax=uncultured Draconibacterium sp. TaxID=1573823 RepID=UPI003261C051